MAEAASTFMTLASESQRRKERSQTPAEVADESLRVQNYLRAVRGELEPVPLPSRSPPAAEPEVYHDN